MTIAQYVLKKPVLFNQSKRTLFHWINLQFNAVDEDRRKQFGPDRVCAEWILRNGGAIKWTNSTEVLSDYNELPKEGTIVRLQEVDASNSSIMHNGFDHFKGCEYVTKVILHKCNYLQDEALAELRHVKGSLMFLQLTSCPNISDNGLLHLSVLQKLKKLFLYNLIAVKKKEQTVQALKSSLTKCDVQFK